MVMRLDNLRRKLLVAATIASNLFLLTAIQIYGQSAKHISAVARGTSTQLGRIINIDIRISSLSTAADQAVLLEAFQADGSEGLANALDKMKAKGRIAITGTLGFDLNYIRRFPQPDGSVLIRFVTDRPIYFTEKWASTRTLDYQISVGEIVIPKGGKMKGTLMPATKAKL